MKPITMKVPREEHTVFYVQAKDNVVYLSKEIDPDALYLGLVRTDICGDVEMMQYE